MTSNKFNIDDIKNFDYENKKYSYLFKNKNKIEYVNTDNHFNISEIWEITRAEFENEFDELKNLFNSGIVMEIRIINPMPLIDNEIVNPIDTYIKALNYDEPNNYLKPIKKIFKIKISKN